jgi:hypothetical protein
MKLRCEMNLMNYTSDVEMRAVRVYMVNAGSIFRISNLDYDNKDACLINDDSHMGYRPSGFTWMCIY